MNVNRRSFFAGMLGLTAGMLALGATILIGSGTASGKARLTDSPPKGVTADDVLEVLDEEFPGRNFAEKARAKAAARRTPG